MTDTIQGLFNIYELTDIQDWLVLLWLTGVKEYAIPPSLGFLAMDGCGIVGIWICDLQIRNQALSCCSTQKRFLILTWLKMKAQ